jgi:dipeptidyl aminopeptidase/acylaminoacyl peptidase
MLAPAVEPARHLDRDPPAETKAPAYLIAINVRDSPDLGKVEFAALRSIDDRTATGLRCERIHVAAGIGICLKREIKFFAAQTIATVVDASFQPLFSVRADGIPSRARVAPDGRYAAFTVFVTGHSYADALLSTATWLVDLEKRATAAHLEEFEVFQDGAAIRSLDFNYWGVTFGRDSNVFYATLRTDGVNHLVRGDIAARRITVMAKGVECPSLSPDQTRIAFKKMIGRGVWRLAVLDLATMKETVLPESRSVDDQAEWLDDGRLLYAVPDPAPWMSIMVVSADGSAQPKLFAKGAASPAIPRP